MNIHIAKKIKSLSLLKKYSFGSLVTCNYPYKFGGIQCKDYNNIPNLFFRQFFGENVLQGFKQAYLSVIQALKDKDRSFLEQTMEKNLIKSISFPDVKIVNQKNPIQVSVHNYFVALGGKFNRDNENPRMVSMFQDQKNGFHLLSSPSQMKSMMGSMNVPLLFGCQIYFKGNTKLVNSNQKSNQNKQSTQCHMLQFQIQNSIGIMQLMNMAQKMKSNGNFNNKDAQEIFKILIGKNYQWKISDMDKSLQGNFEIDTGVKGGGMGGFF